MERHLSMREKILMIFFAVVTLIVIAFIVINSVFWNMYYIRRNQRELMDTYQTLAALVKDENTTNRQIAEVIISAKTGQNISFALQGYSDWEFVMPTREYMSLHDQDFLMERLQANLILGSTENVRILEKTADYTLQRVEVPESGDRYLECYGYMMDPSGQRRSFILSMPLEKIIAGSVVSNQYFIMASLAILAVGMIAISVITVNMTKPIYQLSDISKRMSHMDFSARYTGKQKDELGVLGNNMNEMSSQLERTFLQLKLANETLQKDIKEKEQVDEMRKDFISNVSHELKTPIALIQGYAEGLRELRDDPDSMDYYIDVIIDESDKMNRMVKKLTTLNQLEFGNETMDISDFDIMDMIRGIVSASARLREERHAEVTVEGPESLMVSGDEFRIEEVLNNYYSNAFNHLAEPNRIRIFCSDLGPLVRISVKNTGANIPEEDLDKIWIKFYKVDKARTRAYGGSGIGLSIVKAIMDAHKQECGVYNEPDGVVFWFEMRKAEQNGSDHG